MILRVLLCIEDCLYMAIKKFLTNKFSLLTEMVNRDLALAAATAAATTAFTFFTTTVVQYDQFVHGIHLLSYRCLSIDLVKKIGVQRASTLQFYWLITFISFSVVLVSGANLIINCPQQITIFS